MGSMKVDYNTLFSDSVAFFEADTVLMAEIKGVYEEELSAATFPALVVHGIIKSSEPHEGVGYTPMTQLILPFELIVSSNADAGAEQSLNEMRIQVYNLLDIIEDYIRQNPHWTDTTHIKKAMPGAVTPMIDTRENFRLYHLFGQVLMSYRVW